MKELCIALFFVFAIALIFLSFCMMKAVQKKDYKRAIVGLIFFILILAIMLGIQGSMLVYLLKLMQDVI